MRQPLVECIPNFSEGRRPEVIQAIADAVRNVPSVHLLDLHQDSDHNRCVITFAGPPQAVAEAAFAAIREAAARIDLDQHRGEHPRIGAADVVPFVPLEGITTQECVELAQSLGKRVGEELGIPVYLYEAAATRPDRTNLENIRRGEYEGLKESLGKDPDRAPDFGPTRLGKAGATVIGARAPLIAYNVYLTTDDVGIAKKIAKAIRQSSGGFRCVKALGLLVGGRAQVSINFTDYRQSSVPLVQDAIRREAERYGVGIHHAELVGLMPLGAVVDAARWYLQIDPFGPDQVLETRLYAALAEGTSAGSVLLDQLASGMPTPGGGSAAAYAGAMAASVAAMAARLTLAKPEYARVAARMESIVSEADFARTALFRNVARDAQAFEAVISARRLPRAKPEERSTRDQALLQATIQASSVPLEVARLAAVVLELAAEIAEEGLLSAISDTAAAAALARAALTGASLNVRVNSRDVKDPSVVSSWLETLTNLETRANSAETRLQRALLERANLACDSGRP
jgi:glutamate formiminotransferase/formiminotetrahydrofolate cyclodeaminase